MYILNWNNTVGTNNGGASSGDLKPKERPRLENKSILSIKILGGNKADDPVWIEDMKDTLEDLRPGIGDFIEWIEGLREGIGGGEEIKE